MAKGPEDTRNDPVLVGAMQAAYRAKRIDFYIVFEKLNRQGSPVFSPWDNLTPLLLLMFASLAVLLSLGVIAGIACMFITMGAYLFFIRYWVSHRLHERLVRIALHDVRHFQLCWRFGGFAIGLRDTKEGCMAPDGDWRKFVRRHLQPPIQEDASLGMGL